MIEHDRATGFEAFEQALAISPTSSFTLSFGSQALAYAGDAERAVDSARMLGQLPAYILSDRTERSPSVPLKGATSHAMRDVSPVG
jgi:hypothetical protein